MYGTKRGYGTSLAGLSKTDWVVALGELVGKQGDFGTLDKAHITAFIRRGKTLLVSFETMQGIRALSDTAQPVAFDLVRSDGWSTLSIISDGDTWFRGPQIYAFFDELSDNEFFDEFDNIIFYGAGPCGYAAASYSVASPGSTVVAVQPQASVAPEVTGWDPRFVEMRRVDFSSRYAFAPDMIDAAQRAYIFFDPYERLDAMHAALFRRPHVERMALPNLGITLQTSLLGMGLLPAVLRQAADGTLTRQHFYKIYRARRRHGPYLRNLMARLDHESRPYLNTLLCRNVVHRLSAPRFNRRLEELERSAAEGAFTLPPKRSSGEERHEMQT